MENFDFYCFFLRQTEITDLKKKNEVLEEQGIHTLDNSLSESSYYVTICNNLSLSPCHRTEQGRGIWTENRRCPRIGRQASPSTPTATRYPGRQGHAQYQSGGETDHWFEWAGPLSVVLHGNQNHTHNGWEWSRPKERCGFMCRLTNEGWLN